MDSAEYTDEQLCILALASTCGIGPITINRMVRAARETNRPLCSLIGADAKKLGLGLEVPEKTGRILAGLDAPLETAERTLALLDRANVHPVFREDAGYPEKLALCLEGAAPPVLFVAGEEGLLSGPSVAVVGSRQPSGQARRAAYEFACQLGRRGTIIVSGGARGIDTAAHQGGVRGGTTAVIPPTGILKFRRRDIAPSEARPDRWCIVGQFPPRDRWRTRNALQRNHTIVALSDAVVGFEPRDHGGTWRSCCAALRMRKPLFVVTARRDSAHLRGRKQLVTAGAHALDPQQMPTPRDFGRLTREYSPPGEASQVPLFKSESLSDRGMWG